MTDAAPMLAARSAASSAGATPSLPSHDDTSVPAAASLPTHPSLTVKPQPPIACAPAPCRRQFYTEANPCIIFLRGAGEGQSHALGGTFDSAPRTSFGGGGAHRVKPRLAGVRIKKEKGKGTVGNASGIAHV